MNPQLAETVGYHRRRAEAGGRTMKFTFPPESTPLDGYTIKRAIHRGAFGEVYYALSHVGKEVALKLLKHNLEIELRGVKQCLNLKHPNLVTIFDIRTDADGDHWIVMEYVSGKSLAAVIDEAAGPLPVEEVRKWLAGIVAGLSYLHDRGIVHRDLKPANVFEENGVVKIGDVGLSKFISESRRSAQTESVGTVYYMAPEVARGRYGREVDVYSLAVVLYELLTGRVPFDGESTAEILMKHLTEKPDLSPLPERLRPVLAKALEKDPLRRTPTAAQLQDEFNKALAGIEIATEIPADSFRGGADDGTGPSAFASLGTARQLALEAKHNAKHSVKRAHKVARDAVREAKRNFRDANRQQRKVERERRRQRRHAEQAARRGTNGANPAAVPVGNRTATAGRGRANATKESPAMLWLKIAAVVVVLMALFTPSSVPKLFSLVFVGGIFAALAYGTYRLIGLIAAPLPSSPRAGPDGSPASGAPPGSVQAVADRPVVPRRLRALTPETLRAIPLRYRIADVSGAMTYAVPVTALLTAALWAVMPGMFAGGDVGTAVLFAVTTLLGAWAVLVPSKLWEGTRTQTHIRRLSLIVVGCLVGAAGFWLHRNLMVDVDYNMWGGGGNSVALFHTAGSHSLIEGSQPSLAGYVLFFGALFGLRRWWRHTDAFRKKRFRVSTLLLTALAGFVLPMLFAFPHLWGLMWAVAISTVAQLSGVWVPPAQRPSLMEGRVNV